MRWIDEYFLLNYTYLLAHYIDHMDMHITESWAKDARKKGAYSTGYSSYIRCVRSSKLRLSLDNIRIGHNYIVSYLKADSSD